MPELHPTTKAMLDAVEAVEGARLRDPREPRDVPIDDGSELSKLIMGCGLVIKEWLAAGGPDRDTPNRKVRRQLCRVWADLQPRLKTYHIHPGAVGEA